MLRVLAGGCDKNGCDQDKNAWPVCPHGDNHFSLPVNLGPGGGGGGGGGLAIAS